MTDPMLSELRLLNARLATYRPVSYRRIASAVAAGIIMAAALIWFVVALDKAIGSQLRPPAITGR